MFIHKNSIQQFLRIYMVDFWYLFKAKWHTFTYYLYRKEFYRYQLYKRFHKHPYYGCWELTEQILDYSFEILCEFYEENKLKDIPRWNIDEADEHEKQFLIATNRRDDEIEWLYNWYMVEKPEREEQLAYLLDVWSEHHVSWWLKIDGEYFRYWASPNNKYADYLFNLLQKEEEKFDEEQENALIRLVKVRKFLWK